MGIGNYLNEPVRIWWSLGLAGLTEASYKTETQPRFALSPFRGRFPRITVLGFSPDLRLPPGGACESGFMKPELAKQFHQVVGYGLDLKERLERGERPPLEHELMQLRGLLTGG